MSDDLPRDARPVRNSDVAWRAYDDSALVLEKGGRRAHVLNEVAAHIWQLADGAHDVSAIASDLAGTFDAPVEAIEGDVCAFVRELTDLGLCRLDQPTPGEGATGAPL